MSAFGDKTDILRALAEEQTTRRVAEDAGNALAIQSINPIHTSNAVRSFMKSRPKTSDRSDMFADISHYPFELNQT